MRDYSIWDRFILQVDKTFQSTRLLSNERRPNPAIDIPEPNLTKNQRNHVAGLMRVNHVGEVCAQALYQGQAIAARSKDIQERMRKAAREEVDHLNWCQQRLDELNAHTSYLNPFWYGSAWILGLIAGLFGDKVSLGFLAETERQVERHLDKNLLYLPAHDEKSRAIIKQMRLEEIEHATTAKESGAIPLPLLIQWGMQGLASFMTVVAYYI